MKLFKKYSILFIGLCFNQDLILNDINHFTTFIPTVENVKKMESTSSNLNINHGFSMMINSNLSGNNTLGIYSSKIQYNFNPKMSLLSNIHLINGNYSYSNSPQIDLGFDIAFEYNLSKNSKLFFQFSNLGSLSKNHPNFLLKPGM